MKFRRRERSTASHSSSRTVSRTRPEGAGAITGSSTFIGQLANVGVVVVALWRPLFARSTPSNRRLYGLVVARHHKTCTRSRRRTAHGCRTRRDRSLGFPTKRASDASMLLWRVASRSPRQNPSPIGPRFRPGTNPPSRCRFRRWCQVAPTDSWSQSAYCPRLSERAECGKAAHFTAARR